MALTDTEKVQRALDNGVLAASRVMALCRELDFPFYIACAYLEQEATDPDTGKHGANLWGSDPTGFRGVDLEEIFGDRNVTREIYQLYLLSRDKLGAQGVGPMQLTYPDLQDEADALGGCWKPIVNIRVGLTLLLKFKAQEGTWHNTAGRYNGSGPDGNYATHNDELRAKWKAIFDE